MSTMSTDLAQRTAALLERANAEPPTTWKPRDRAERHPVCIAGAVVEKGEKHGAGYNGETIVTSRSRRLRARAGWSGVSGRSWQPIWRRAESATSSRSSTRVTGKGAATDTRCTGSSSTAPARAPAPAGFAEVSASSSATTAIRCDQCGYTEPDHAAGCPLEIPF